MLHRDALARKSWRAYRSGSAASADSSPAAYAGAMSDAMSHADLVRALDGLESQLPSLLAQCRGTGERVRAIEHATAAIAHARLQDVDAIYARRRLLRLLLAAGLAADEVLDAPLDVTPS
jgi:hypothetical protein